MKVEFPVSDCKNFLGEMRALVLEDLDAADVFKKLCSMDAEFESISIEEFKIQWFAHRFAQLCLFWVECCQIASIEDRDTQNYFFKELMGTFESSESMPLATAFSEALYAANSDRDTPGFLASLSYVFRKLGVEPIVSTDSEQKIHDAYMWLATVCEGMKIDFENRFDAFMDRIVERNLLKGE